MESYNFRITSKLKICVMIKMFRLKLVVLAVFCLIMAFLNAQSFSNDLIANYEVIEFSEFYPNAEKIFFGATVVSVGDVNNDGTSDYVVGSPGAGYMKGKLWYVFTDIEGKAKEIKKIAGFTGWYNEAIQSITALGDIDGDGDPEIAVNNIGSMSDMDKGNYYAIQIFTLKKDGVSVKSLISDYATNAKTHQFRNRTQDLMPYLNCLGDLNGDGVNDLVVGVPNHDGNGKKEGAILILFLNSNGSLKKLQEISSDNGDFQGILNSYDRFGYSVTAIGDVDSDGVVDIAVGAPEDNDSGTKSGAVWVLFLNQNGTVKRSEKISNARGNMSGKLDNTQMFGGNMVTLGDLNRDGINEIGVLGYDNSGNKCSERLRILFLSADGKVMRVEHFDTLNENLSARPDRGSWSNVGMDAIEKENEISLILGCTNEEKLTIVHLKK